MGSDPAQRARSSRSATFVSAVELLATEKHLALNSPRRQCGNQLVHDVGHFLPGGKAELADRNKRTDPTRRCIGHVAEHALQATRLLQDERPVLAWHHDYPAEAEGVHAPGLVHSEYRIEAVPIHIRRVIEKAHLRIGGRRSIQVPGDPAQDVVGAGVESAGKLCPCMSRSCCSLPGANTVDARPAGLSTRCFNSSS